MSANSIKKMFQFDSDDLERNVRRISGDLRDPGVNYDAVVLFYPDIKNSEELLGPLDHYQDSDIFYVPAYRNKSSEAVGRLPYGLEGAEEIRYHELEDISKCYSDIALGGLEERVLNAEVPEKFSTEEELLF